MIFFSKSDSFFTIVVFVVIIILAACESPVAEQDVVLKRGLSEFKKELYELKNPKGVLPTMQALDWQGVNNAGIIFHVEENFYEFFVFDRSTSLFLLSLDPLVFIKLNSKMFYAHLVSELSQLKSGTPSAEKVANSIPSEQQVGNLRVSLAFIPHEVYSSKQTGRYIDIANLTFIEPEYLIEAANKLVMYTPIFEEERLYTLLEKRKREDLLDLVQYTSGEYFSQYFKRISITNYIDPLLSCRYTFFFGEDLERTTNLLKSANNTYSGLIDDFTIFTASALGNSQSSERAFWSRSEKSQSGFVLTLRGDQSEVKKFLEDEGFDFKPERPLPVYIGLVDGYHDQLEVISSDDCCKQFEYMISENGAPFQDALMSITEDRLFINGIKRGSHYSLIVNKPGEDKVIAHTEIYCSELIISEVAFWGSAFRKAAGSNDDDWIEILNVGSTVIDIGEYDFVLTNSTGKQNFWFGPSNSGTKSHDPVHFILAPGERCVAALITADADVDGMESFFDNDAYGSSPAIFKAGTLSENSISSSYKISILKKGKIINQVTTDNKYGGKLPFKSMVLNSQGQWTTSQYNTTCSPYSDMLYTHFATPAFACAGEI